MSCTRRAPRWMLSGSMAMALLGARAAHASDTTAQCLDAYETGQRLRQSGDLVGAASELRVCGGPACPVRMQGDCQRWLDDVEHATPTVVFRVRDPDGELLPEVQVSIDGAKPRRLDGRALLINPGEHVVRFERSGFAPLETPVFVTEGEKLEPREVTLEPLAGFESRSSMLTSGQNEEALAASLPAQDESHRSSAWPLALGAVGLAGGVGFVYFGVRAKNGETDLERCSPDCRQAQVDDVKGDYLLSNVSLGVGLAGLLGMGLFLILDDPDTDGASSTPRHALTLGTTTTWVTRW